MKQYSSRNDVNMTFSIADDAVDHIIKLRNDMGKRHVGYLRIGIREDAHACCGPAYALEFTDENRPDDFYFVFECSFVGILRVLIEPKWKDMFDNAELKLTAGTVDKRLYFENPNVQKTCGCGKK